MQINFLGKRKFVHAIFLVPPKKDINQCLGDASCLETYFHIGNKWETFFQCVTIVSVAGSLAPLFYVQIDFLRKRKYIHAIF